MQPAAAAPPAAAAKQKTTTLLDAYEVECIRRELERLVLKHNHQSAGAAAAGDDTAAAPPNARGHRCRNEDHHLHRQRMSSAGTKATGAKQISPSPPSVPPPGPKKSSRGVRLLGRHAVVICSGTVPVAGAATSGRGRRAVAICSGTVPVPGAATSGRGQRAVAICRGGGALPVACAAVGAGGGRRRPRGEYQEVEKV